jgi:hypothetical protein
MLELSIALPIKVQNGGLFISRGVGRHPARKLTSWEIIFVEKGTLTILEENTLFEVKAGESLLLWPDRRHVGVEDFRQTSNSTGCILRLKTQGSHIASGNRTTLQRQGCAICYFSVSPVSERAGKITAKRGAGNDFVADFAASFDLFWI